MFQDIAPHRLSITYAPQKPQAGDYLIYIRDNKVLTMKDSPSVLPQYGTEPFESTYGYDESLAQFLLSVDETSFFLMPDNDLLTDGTWKTDALFRTMEPEWLGFAAATAFHLAKWYDSHRSCGRCTTPLEQLPAERALKCPECGIIEHPKISPVVIVGIIDGNKILLTKYSVAAAAYRKYTLVAGFVEIGETFEDAIRREVLEEVGVEVHNITYYKSQPWGFSQSLLAGFFAEADSQAPLSIDSEELSEAVWCRREDLPRDDTTMSLTWSMIEAFRGGWKL